MLYNIAGGGISDLILSLLKSMCTLSSGGDACGGWTA